MSDDARRLYGKQLARFGEVLTETASRGIHPDKVAKVVHKAISSDNPRHRYLVGTDAKIAARLKGTLPERDLLEARRAADEDADRRAGGVALASRGLPASA